MKITYTDFLNEKRTQRDIRQIRHGMFQPIGTILPESDIYNYCQSLHNEEDFIDGNIGDRIEKFNKFELKEISIDNIETERYQLDNDVVEKYIKKYKKWNDYPPIVLGKYDGEEKTYDIIDGNHRTNALIEAGVKTAKAWVGKK